MNRVAVVLLLVAPVAAVAAPIPALSESEQIAKFWGKTFGYSQDDEFKLTGKTLTIRTAGQPHEGLINGERNKTARVSRTIAGDFEVTVKVLDSTPPNTEVKHTGAYPWTRAGLCISGEKFGVEYHLSQFNPKINGVVQEQLSRVVYLDSWYPGGGMGHSTGKVEVGKSVYLRVTRKGKTVTVSHSSDGKEWSAPQSPRQPMGQGLELPPEVTIGVFVNHTTHQSVAASFAEFNIEFLKQEPAKEEKPK